MFISVRVSPEAGQPDTPEYVEVGFEGGDAVSINGEKTNVASDTFWLKLNELLRQSTGCGPP